MLALAATLALALGPGGAQADDVTTNAYTANSTDTDIDKSCKNLDLNESTGDVSATCNPSTTESKVGLDSYAQCRGGTLEWGTGGFVDETGNYLSARDVRVTSDGQSYVLRGTCASATGATDLAEDSLRLDERLRNNGGKLEYSTSQ